VIHQIVNSRREKTTKFLLGRKRASGGRKSLERHKPPHKKDTECDWRVRVNCVIVDSLVEINSGFVYSRYLQRDRR
jgi:hypothetical protein